MVLLRTNEKFLFSFPNKSLSYIFFVLVIYSILHVECHIYHHDLFTCLAWNGRFLLTKAKHLILSSFNIWVEKSKVLVRIQDLNYKPHYHGLMTYILISFHSLKQGVFAGFLKKAPMYKQYCLTIFSYFMKLQDKRASCFSCFMMILREEPFAVK